MKLPYGGYFVEAQSPPAKPKPTIVFVHHWGGNRSSSRLHMNYVASLGFRSFTFSQSFHSRRTLRMRAEIFPEVLLGMRHVWADEVSEVLDFIEGDKILYSFSFPSSAALIAIGRRQAHDVKGWICDGGPFLDLHQCYRNYFTHQTPIKNAAVRELAVLGGYFFFGAWNIRRDFKNAFSKLPPDFRVLSLRGMQDPLVSPEAIEEAFELSQNLNLNVVSMAEGKHIDGLRNCSAIYKAALTEFLSVY